MEKYQDREEAGSVVADNLKDYMDNPNAIVLALARGGVPVGYEIAKKLHLPLDVMIVRKLGVPTNPEFAFGAITSGGVIILNQEIIKTLALKEQVIAEIKEKEEQELTRREKVYRGARPLPNIENKTVILVDDGIATGYTVKAAIIALRKQNPAQIILAVPVAPQDTLKELQNLVDDIVCPLIPDDLQAVGLWYRVFAQTSDAEVIQLLG
ncbi:MAG: phosphoribosyl transferase [Legionellales bacterium RIFCSPHIGHO2_12_FULL_37_14]|nr:MAG: phosphoribosyl transferase [Legionellales bacterium RIFCSPHIGHO2_12_FULL_37_14]